MMPHWDTGEVGANAAYRSTPAWDVVTGGKILSINGVYTTRSLTAGQISGILRPQTWGWGVGREVPPNAKIRGIEVKITRHGVGIRDYNVQLYYNSTLAGDNKADTATEWGTTDQTITYGGPTDTWGISDVQGYLLSDAYAFGINIRAKNHGAVTSTAYIDCVTVKVYYQCYIFESTTEDGYIKFRNLAGGTPLTYDSIDKTSDDLSSLNSSSTVAAVDIPFAFFNTGEMLNRKRIVSATWSGNINTVVDYTPNGSAGQWTFYINKAQGDTLTSADTVGWDNLVGSGGAFWETGAEPLTDGAGYYWWDITAFAQYINQEIAPNSGYTNVVVLPYNTGNDVSPESTYLLIDSADKVGGYPMRLVIVTDEDDPLDTLELPEMDFI